VANDFTASLRILKRDKRLAPLIRKYGPPRLKWNKLERIDVFHALCRSIIYQQISGKAASAILSRFHALFPRKKPTPALVLRAPHEDLRAAGLSAQKASYLKDLAKRFVRREIEVRRFPRMSSAEIIEHLVHVKGIGEWTAHMVLIFTLGRRDILPTGDLGIRKGFQAAYGLESLPKKTEMERLAASWREHASIASWYLWRAADEMKP
jgi:DNA-3-methyladenine glycosylase II